MHFTVYLTENLTVILRPFITVWEGGVHGNCGQKKQEIVSVRENLEYFFSLFFSRNN